MKKLLNIEEDFLNELGIVDWGYTEDPLPASFNRFESWVERGGHGPLNYLSDHRKDLRKSLESVNKNFKSALVFLFSYAEDKASLEKFYKGDEANGLRVGAYSTAFGGVDYHYVLKDRLQKLGEKVGGEFKISLDVHPVLERDLAYKTGLGWFGKNSMLIHQKKGSFNMIGALLFNKTFEVDLNEIQTDHCGQCTACIDICPTDAIDIQKREIVASKCISTFTIELFKDAEPPAGYSSSQEIFGCDLCQDVCPWNIRRVNNGEVLPNQNWPEEKAEEVVNYFLKPSKEDLISGLQEISNRGYQKKFKGTSFERTGKQGLLKNLIKKT